MFYYKPSQFGTDSASSVYLETSGLQLQTANLLNKLCVYGALLLLVVINDIYTVHSFYSFIFSWFFPLLLENYLVFSHGSQHFYRSHRSHKLWRFVEGRGHYKGKWRPGAHKEGFRAGPGSLCNRPPPHLGWGGVKRAGHSMFLYPSGPPSWHSNYRE